MGARKRNSLVTKWCIRYVVVIFMAIAFLISVTAYFKQDYERLSMQTLKARLDTTTEFYNRILESGMPMLYIASEIKELTKNQFYMAFLFNQQGEVIISHGRMGQLNSQPFAIKEIGEITRTSNGERVISIDRKLEKDGVWIATLRFSTSLRQLDFKYQQFVLGLSFVSFLLLSLLVLLSYIFMRSMVKPLIDMKNIAEVYAKGNFDVDMTISRNDEIGQLAETMQSMARELKHMEDSKYQFIDSVTHELRTPMTSILGWCDLMEMRPELSDKGIQMIKIETQRLGELVSNFMAFNAMKFTQELKLSQFDLIELLEEVLLVFKPRMDRYFITAEKQWASEVLPVVSDRGKLKQVIVNILDNAMKFSSQNTTIQITQENRQEGYFISVVDQGSGIPKEHLNQLTNKYFRGSSDKQGMGLGLAIVSDLMHCLSGTLKIESQLGIGTQVTLEFKTLMVEDVESLIHL